MSSAWPEDRLERELRDARLEIERLRALCARADEKRHEAELALLAERAQNTRYVAQLVALRNTVSWRVTSPIRVVRRLHATMRS